MPSPLGASIARCYPRLQRLLLALLCASSGVAAGQEMWALCPVEGSARPLLPASPGNGATSITAERATTLGGDRATFFGDVFIIRGDKTVEADRADYDRRDDVVNISGNVRLTTPQMVVNGDDATFDLTHDSGSIERASFRFPAMHAFGTADQILFPNLQSSRLVSATYSTCPPGNEDWQLRAAAIEIDRAENEGEAWNVVVTLGGVPALYLPYLNFPLEGRKSGFLAPVYGSSERNGNDFAFPYYFNLAPNRDATLTPRIISRRGGMFLGEYRYLDQEMSGEVHFDYLPHDSQRGTERSNLAILHRQQLSPRWSALLDFRQVSDINYFNEIDTTLASTSLTYLPRRLDVMWNSARWSFLSRVQDFQSLLPSAATPYRVLPQLLLSGAAERRVGEVQPDLRAEYVNFSRDIPPDGGRLDLYPGLTLPLEGPAWFLTPRVALRYTQYDLRRDSGEPRPARTLPITSLDGGVVFERELTVGGAPAVHTLEPRLYYLHIPYVDQRGLPLFDTNPTTFSFGQLFRENRFSGADRVSDADQVTVAVTSRLLGSESGREWGRVSVGEIYYFKRPQVPEDYLVETTGAGSANPDRTTSDVAAELAGRPLADLEVSASAIWDPTLAEAREGALRVNYERDPDHRASLAYRAPSRGDRTSDLLALWPLGRQWKGVTRWYFDLDQKRSLEMVVGVEYESCCWSLRFIGSDRPFVEAATGAVRSDRSFYITLQLKGLANVGQGLESVIRDRWQ